MAWYDFSNYWEDFVQGEVQAVSWENKYFVTFIDETIGDTSSLCTHTDEILSKKAEEYVFET